jgi:hypothetical protein
MAPRGRAKFCTQPRLAPSTPMPTSVTRRLRMLPQCPALRIHATMTAAGVPCPRAMFSP